MLLSKRKTRVATLLAATVAAMGIGAGAASAAPATFNISGQTAHWTPMTPVTFTWGTTITPFKTVTCGPQAIFGGTINGTADNLGSPLQGAIDFLRVPQVMSCSFASGGSTYVTLEPTKRLAASNTGGAYSLDMNSGAINVRLFCCSYWAANSSGPVTFSVPWTNGAGAGNPSKVTFSSTLIGMSNLSEPVRMTGTFAVTNSGGPLTLS